MSLQRQQKQRQLLGRLQDLLLGPKADEQTTCEVLDYFLRRLGSSQVASRVLAMKVSPAAGVGSRSLLPSATLASRVTFLPPWTSFLTASMHRRDGASKICQRQFPLLVQRSFSGGSVTTPGDLVTGPARPVRLH